MLWILTISSLVLGAVYWMASVIAGIKLVRALPQLASFSADGPDPAATVSIVLAARDEERAIGATLERLAQHDARSVEIIVCDDRSTDATGRIATEFADQHPNLRVERIDELPEGWLGKVHALARGARVASGEWLLFTDADVIVPPAALHRALVAASSVGADHVAVLPHVSSSTSRVAACIEVFARWLVLAGQLWLVNDPRSTATFGVGAFNLVRAETLRASRGFEWIRLDLADDASIGLLVQEVGGRTLLLAGRDEIHVEWQSTVRGMARNMEKYGSIQFGASAVRAVAAVSIGCLGELAPWIALAAAPTVPTRAIAAALCMVALVSIAGMSAWSGTLRPAAVIMQPLAVAAVGWMMMRAVWLERRRGGVVWRDTWYATADLRAGQRYQVTQPGRRRGLP